MLGGYQRKMYYIRDTRSRLFREAYFVLREDADSYAICENDLAAEADRILREKFPVKKRKWRTHHTAGAMFVLGAVIGAVLMVAIL